MKIEEARICPSSRQAGKFTGKSSRWMGRIVSWIANRLNALVQRIRNLFVRRVECVALDTRPIERPLTPERVTHVNEGSKNNPIAVSDEGDLQPCQLPSNPPGWSREDTEWFMNHFVPDWDAVDLSNPVAPEVVREMRAPVTGADKDKFNRLCQAGWLNADDVDDVIERLQRDTDSNVKLCGHFQNFFSIGKGARVADTNTERAKRRQRNWFDADTILVPCNRGDHWVLTEVDKRNKQMRIYDPLGNHYSEEQIAPIVFRILESASELLDEPFDRQEWTVEKPVNTPLQNNGSDCGVFICLIAEQIMREGTVTDDGCGPAQVPMARLRFLHWILNR